MELPKAEVKHSWWGKLCLHECRSSHGFGHQLEISLRSIEASLDYGEQVNCFGETGQSHQRRPMRTHIFIL